MSDPLIERWRGITRNMQAAREGSLLAAPQVTLVAVSKTHSAEMILPLLAAGQRAFGENKVQEAEAKWPALRERYHDVELHLIGSLQSNKAREALALCDAIETIDRHSLADALAKERARGPTRCRQFFVQVNIGEEAQKGGVPPAQLTALLAHCAALELPITGLMCVPPADDNPAPYFALLLKLARENAIAGLSMGMSGDYDAAIRFGATHIRVGTALFGER